MREQETDIFKASIGSLAKSKEAIKTILGIISFNANSSIAVTANMNGPRFLSDISIESAICTLDSVILCVQAGHLGDAYVLARKFRDDLFQYLFLRKALEDEFGFIISENPKAWGELSEQELSKMIEDAWKNFMYGERSSVHNAAEAWLKNDIDGVDTQNLRKEYFDASKYLRELRKNKDIDDCYRIFFADEYLQQDRVLNNYVHSNGQTYVFANLNLNNQSRKDELVIALEKNVLLSAIMFLSIIVLISPSLIGTSDYVDALDCGVVPIDGSQYWVAEDIVDFMDNYFPMISVKLKQYLHDENKFSMQICKN